ncbi:transglutaminase-like domain-containing protein [Novosphingobium sp.]|uniref:transglutaminase-like domain-containing protein n=1 Tax=Novosphingobium sp. TaxID=1874826 RepID=UPI003D119860
MLIKAGFDIAFGTNARTPMSALLSVHPSRNRDLQTRQSLVISPNVPSYNYVDAFGNTATRFALPAGGGSLHSEFIIADSGLPDTRAPDVPVRDVHELPADVLPFLLASRYCETDQMMQTAWWLFGGLTGRTLIESIVDWVHNHITFGYQYARNTRTAAQGYQEGVGVCRDFAHLAVTMCRCMNIPARYCTGYLGDIGVPVCDAPMDFSAWFEVFVDGDWYTYDARHNMPRIGRIVMARGRDATDVAITTNFGNAWLTKFEVTTYEVVDEALRNAA